MKNDYEVLLTPGWGYCQVQRIDSTKKDGSALIGYNNEPMIKLTLNIVDCMGVMAKVADFVSPSATWKISNIEESFKIEGFLKDGEFNKDVLIGKSCVCSMDVKSTERYGNQMNIKMYLPIEFATLVNSNVTQKDAQKEAKVPASEFPPINTLVPDSIEDDDIPF